MRRRERTRNHGLPIGVVSPSEAARLLLETGAAAERKLLAGKRSSSPPKRVPLPPPRADPLAAAAAAAARAAILEAAAAAADAPPLEPPAEAESAAAADALLGPPDIDGFSGDPRRYQTEKELREITERIDEALGAYTALEEAQAAARAAEAEGDECDDAREELGTARHPHRQRISPL